MRAFVKLEISLFFTSVFTFRFVLSVFILGARGQDGRTFTGMTLARAGHVMESGYSLRLKASDRPCFRPPPNIFPKFGLKKLFIKAGILLV